MGPRSIHQWIHHSQEGVKEVQGFVDLAADHREPGIWDLMMRLDIQEVLELELLLLDTEESAEIIWAFSQVFSKTSF